MAMRRFKVVLEWDAEDAVWVTYVPALNFLSTFADSREEALAQTREAIEGYLETAQMEGIALPASDGGIEIAEVEVAST